MLAPIREYATKKGIAEPEYGFFTMPADENSFCLTAGWIIMYFLDNPEQKQYFSTVISDFDDDVGDCLEAIHEVGYSL